jgi:WD40 repeat protein
MPFDYMSCRRKRAAALFAALTTNLCLINYAGTIPARQQKSDSPSARPELVLQIGHTGKVIAFSPDGKTLASGGDDRTLKLWDMKTGELKRTLIGHGAKLTTIAFSRDGKTLAADGGDGWGCGTGDGGVGETILWDTQTWAVKRRLPNGFFKFFSIAFSPNIRNIVFSSDDYTEIWNASTGKLRRRLANITGVVAFSPDGRTIAIAGWDGTVQLRYAQSGEPKRTLKGPAGESAAVAFSPDGRILVRASGEMLTVWNTRTGEINQTLQVDGGNILFSPDSKLLAGWSGSETLKLWDARTWQVKRTLSLPDLHATSFAFSPDSKMLAFGCADEAVRLCNIQTGAMRMLTRSSQSLDPALGEPRGIALSPDGLTAAMGSGNTMYLWNTQTGEMKKTLIGHQGFINSVAFSPDGKMMATGSRDNTVRLWDPRTGSLKRTLTEATLGDQIGVGFLPDGRTVAGVTGELMLLWDAQTGRRKPMPMKHVLGSVAFSPDGKVMATWRQGSEEVILMDGLTGKTRKTIAVYPAWVSQIIFSPDSKMLAAAQECGLVTLWDAQTGAVLKKVNLAGEFEYISSVAFSPDGKIGAGGCSDNTVRLFDVQTGKLKRTLKGHSNDVIWVAFSPDGKTLASGGDDNTLKIWEPNSGRLLATLMVLASKKGEAIEWIAFTPEGYYNGSAGAARFIRWRVGDQLAPAATYESTFHRPDLVQISLKGEQ